MASGVNVKMGVSGVSQFKQDINAVKQSLKTMDAQLSLTEKEFKETGDAEKYLQDKATELNAKLQMQKSILSNAEKALANMNKFEIVPGYAAGGFEGEVRHDRHEGGNRAAGDECRRRS